MESELYFVTCYFNPLKLKSRMRLYDEFVKHVVHDLQIPLIIVQGIDSSVDARIETGSIYTLINIPLESTLWVKEAMINIGIQYIINNKPKARAIAWVDCDIHFHTLISTSSMILDSLKKHHVSQIWNVAMDSGEVHSSINKINYSAVFQQEKFNHSSKPHRNETFTHSGYAWAATIEFLTATKGLLDCCIVGGADRIMMMGMQGKDSLVISDPDYSEGYKEIVAEWSKRAFAVTKGNITYTPIPITHGYHGLKTNRKYKERHNILKRYKYDPSINLVRTYHGLWKWSDKTTQQFKSEVENYFINRKEDDDSISQRTPSSCFSLINFFKII